MRALDTTKNTTIGSWLAPPTIGQQKTKQLRKSLTYGAFCGCSGRWQTLKNRILAERAGFEPAVGY